jgi:MtrB/PioB family decaheme-associated outer membrane protein
MAALAASISALPICAHAQTAGAGEQPAAALPAPDPQNWVQIGGAYQSAPGFYLNRYRGLPDAGFKGLLDFQIRGGSPWDSGGTNYWDFEGHDMGFPDRSFSAKFGQQGTWQLQFSYDGIPYIAADTFSSIWQRSGAVVPGIAPASLGLGSGIAYKQIAPAVPSIGFPYTGTVAGPAIWQPVFTKSISGLLYNYGNMGTQRDIFTGNGKYQWGDWTITASLRHEHKSGYQANSLNVSGLPSATTSSATVPTTFTSALGYFAMPIDYDTDRYDITAAYATQVVQAQIGYTFSNFKDNLTAFNAGNPFSFTGTTFGSLANQAAMFAPYSLPPSNSAHQVKMMLGWNITPTMRVNANFAYGLMMQNAAYDLAVGNPAFVTAGAPAGLVNAPRASLDGLVRTLFGNVAFTAQPLPKLDVRVAYTLDDRNNQSPRNFYSTNVNSLATTSATSDCVGNPCGNLPYSYNHQTITAEASYRILPQTKVLLNDTFETTYRTFANTSLVTSNTITAKVRSQMMDILFGSLSYSHQDRTAHNYTNNATFTLLNIPDRDPVGFVQYFLASRRHDDIKAMVDLSPTSNLTASMLVKFSKDVYPDGSSGLRNNHNLVIGPDVNWQVMPSMTLHAFYNYQQIYYEQSSIYQSSTTAPPTASSFIVPWSAKSTDSVHTAGLSMEWQAIKDELKFSLDYNFAYGDTAYALGDSVTLFGASVAGSQITAANINLQPLPDVTSMLNMVSVRGEWTFRPNWTLIFGYAYERFTYRDFMTGIPSTQYANILLPGTLNPNESIHVIGAGMRVRF